MILESLPFHPPPFSLSLFPSNVTASPSSQSADGLSLIFYEYLADTAAHNYSRFRLISQIKKIRLFVKEMYAAPLHW